MDSFSNWRAQMHKIDPWTMTSGTETFTYEELLEAIASLVRKGLVEVIEIRDGMPVYQAVGARDGEQIRPTRTAAAIDPKRTSG